MSNPRFATKYGFVVAAGAVIFQVTAYLFLVNLPPVRVYAISMGLAVALFGLAFFVRKKILARAGNESSLTKE